MGPEIIIAGSIIQAKEHEWHKEKPGGPK